MIVYQGHRFEGYNKPRPSWLRGKKMVVLAKVGSQVKLIHFGDRRMQDFRQHRDPNRRKNYLRRSAGIRDKQGRLTKDNPLSANYWSRRILWAAR
jgi:hypothetical protein